MLVQLTENVDSKLMYKIKITSDKETALFQTIYG